MGELRKEDILRDNNSDKSDSITSLSLTHKALSSVSCLSDFNKLQRLDLSFNSLTSLKGLESCFNLKWLSVQQNKLLNLNGIQALTNLAVFNAGKNKLKSMDEVKNLVKLRALILNDNDIGSISGLDQLIELNTLVLSRNPIRTVGNSLAKQKSIVKISLSNCQLEDIDNSIKACTGLQQLRLAHNDIKTLPEGLAYSKKLQILDLGNNMISRWSDLEVLSSLHNLKNLNLHGNPIAEKAKLIKKVKKLVPSLEILNSKKMDMLSSKNDQKVESAMISVGNELKRSKKKDNDVKHWITNSNNSVDANSDKQVNQKGVNNDHKLAKAGVLEDDSYFMAEKSSGNLNLELNANVYNEKEHSFGKKRDQKTSRKAKSSEVAEGEPDLAHIVSKKDHKKKDKHVEKEDQVLKADKTMNDKRSKRKVEHLDVIDDKETPFAELLTYDATESMNPNDGQRRGSQGVGKFDTNSALVTYPAKKKKTKNQGVEASVFQSLTPEFGLGGPSAWNDAEE
ncbi:leucine-rich repeat-containing protein 40-like [Chenopodium quinoa]|uniref:Protein phosphatase 1 regulatory subunit 7 n=1 Tax=Chenopodium quinoa TaxID=63459 RepID=A0A803KR70_CHEQI|nr:leucine-rich repeat-containing protein 40-like [Chenopodium quinoa]